MAIKKSWREKLSDSKDLPKVVELKEPARTHWKSETMAIPSPLEVNGIMAQIPAGRLITINEIRTIVAQRHGAGIGCPLTCGIFAWIAAHAASEEAGEGGGSITPYWRTLKRGGELNPKYPGGAEEQKCLLEAEGFTVIRRGRKFVVENFENYLVREL